MAVETLQQAEETRRACLARMRELDAEYPGEPAFDSIIKQLDYLAAFLPTGAPIPRVDDLTFGFLATRHVREFDDKVTRPLAELSQFVRSDYGRGRSPEAA